MYTNTLFKKLRENQTVYGFSVNFGSPGMVEMLGGGWDYIWLDKQHGQLSYDSILNCCIAARAASVETIIRAPGHDYSVLGPLADLCPASIMVPMVNSAQEAKQISQALHFPPLGTRSYWNSRMITLLGDCYNETVDLLAIAQIETVEGLKSMDAIIDTDGIDCLMLGACDLSLSMGLPMGSGRRNNVKMEKAAMSLVKSAKEAGKYSMIIASNPTEAEELKAMGVNIIVCGSDTGFLCSGASSTLAALRSL